MKRNGPSDDSIKLLYVDDEPALLELGKLFLERGGDIEVDIVGCPLEAIEIILRERYDVIISDYEMPGMNGIELLKNLRASGDDIPFIIFTGKGREEVVIEALNNGADFYLQKGGDPRSQFMELTHMVRYAYRMRRTSMALKVKAAMDAALDGMCLLDDKRRVVYANHAMAETYRLPSPERLVGLSWRSLFEETGCTRLKEEFFLHVDDEKGLIAFSNGIRDDGEVFPLEISASRTDDGDIIVAIKDMSEIRQAQDALRVREELLQALTEITDSFIDADPDTVDTVIDASLERIGRVLDVDRTYIFRYDMDKGTSSNTHEWCAEGVEAQIGNLQDIPNDAFPEWVESHSEGRLVIIPDVDSMPESDKKTFLKEQDIKSLLAIPMHHKGGCVGFVGYDSVEEGRIYSEMEVNILTIFSGMVVNLRLRS